MPYSSAPPFRSYPSRYGANQPPYVARVDDQDDVVEMPVEPDRALIIHEPGRGRKPYEPRHAARQSTSPCIGGSWGGGKPPEVHPPLSGNESGDFGPSKPAHDYVYEDTSTWRNHQYPVIGIYEGLEGVIIFVNREMLRSAKRGFTILMIIVLLLVLDNVPDAVELMLSMFRF